MKNGWFIRADTKKSGILEPPNLIYLFLIWPLFSTPYFTHIFYSCIIHGFRVRYIQVTRSAEVGTDGLHATVQALTTFGTGGSFRLILLRTGGSLVLYTFCMLQQDLLLFPCAGGADPSLVRDPCQAREQKLTTRAKKFWGRYGTTPKHPSRTRARLATLRSLNWPDNYDELSSPEQTAVRATQDQKMTEYRLAVNSAAHAASQQAVATHALIAWTTTNSTDTPVKATNPGTEASLANPIDL